MTMRVRRLAAILVLLTFTSASAAPTGSAKTSTPSGSDQSLTRFMQWAPGEYDNNEQVWQEDLDKVAKPHRHDHVIVVNAHASAMGEHTLFVQQNGGDKQDETVGLRLLRVSRDATTHAIRLDAYAFANEAKYVGAFARPATLAAIVPADLVHRQGCSLDLADHGDRFEGRVRTADCRSGSPSGGFDLTTGSMRLSPEGLWLQDEGDDVGGAKAPSQPGSVPSRNRRVRYFSGWTIVKKAGPGAGLEDQSMWSMVRFVIHNEGQILPIKDDKTGADTGYSLQLAQLTYQNTRDPILKIGLIENSSGRTVAYSWASTDAKQLGMNLRWFQAGVTARTDDAGKFGFIQTK